ncbi:hypothetical protein Syun_004221 [Stephania yunnanensis]|uniref:Uncharacterized protein n=1 Tax=Stephania yunnanensis TaxID=152371 RepID=A0AAP0L6S4_9MAGN
MDSDSKDGDADVALARPWNSDAMDKHDGGVRHGVRSSGSDSCELAEAGRTAPTRDDAAVRMNKREAPTRTTNKDIATCGSGTDNCSRWWLLARRKEKRRKRGRRMAYPS